jgi:hypothetical protein
MTAMCKITYSAADGRHVPAHYVQVCARNLAAWNRKAAKAARTAALHDETVAAIARGDDRPYQLTSPAASGVTPHINSVAPASRAPMRGLTPIH